MVDLLIFRLIVGCYVQIEINCQWDVVYHVLNCQAYPKRTGRIQDPFDAADDSRNYPAVGSIG